MWYTVLLVVLCKMCTLCGRKIAPFYFCNNFVKLLLHYVLVIFGTLSCCDTRIWASHQMYGLPTDQTSIL